MRKKALLIVSKREHDITTLCSLLPETKYILHKAVTTEQMLSLLKSLSFHALIFDSDIIGMNESELIQELKQQYPRLIIILLSYRNDINSIMSAMKAGALDFITKPIAHKEVTAVIRRLESTLNQQCFSDDRTTESLISISLSRKIGKELIGWSESIKSNLEIARKAAGLPDTTVMITGESGTGKEIFARIIHYSSSRSKAAFVPINCSSIPDTLMESEFFGHRKGAFTNAIQDKPGYFEIADKGTLFLDEIADMDFRLQAKLLRVLEEKKVRRVGGIHEIDIDTRVIAATNRDIKKLVDEGKFRLDLYHRLNTLCINILPLRERREDIPLLVDYYTRQLAEKLRVLPLEITPVARNYFMEYDFPGNVR
ncbi:MAG: sigma-54 dependent transcriptional regulator, partial [Candidatus Cloacimonetes bacterium]|nr:sigma-54 dependent transcriptional regulator [Candidatus Cloacimonadota bacterium]